MEEGEVKFEKFQIRRIRRRGGENDDSEDIENKMGKSPIIYKDKKFTSQFNNSARFLESEKPQY